MDKLDYQELRKFKSIIAEIRTAKFIVAETKFVTLLKFIAFSNLFTQLFSACMGGFNFDSEFTKAVSSPESERNPNIKFVMPSDMGFRIALVFSILYYIDGGLLDFLEFINDYFPNEETGLSYSDFVKTIIDPLERDVEYMLIEPVFDEDEQEEVYQEPEEIISLSDVESILNELKMLENIVITTKKLSESEKDEVKVLLERFSDVISVQDITNIKSSWYGFKNAIKKVPRVKKGIRQIDDTLAYLWEN